MKPPSSTSVASSNRIRPLTSTTLTTSIANSNSQNLSTPTFRKSIRSNSPLLSSNVRNTNTTSSGRPANGKHHFKLFFNYFLHFHSCLQCEIWIRIFTQSMGKRFFIFSLMLFIISYLIFFSIHPSFCVFLNFFWLLINYAPVCLPYCQNAHLRPTRFLFSSILYPSCNC